MALILSSSAFIAQATDPVLQDLPFVYYTADRNPTISEPLVYSGIPNFFYYWWNTTTNDIYVTVNNTPNSMVWYKTATSQNIESMVAPIIASAITANNSAPKIYIGSSGNSYFQDSNAKFLATTASTSSGAATFYLTSDGTSSGAAICTNTVYDATVSLAVNSSTVSYQSSWTIASDRKSLTATVNQTSGITLLGLQVLSGLSPSANGTVVRLNLICK